MWFKAEIIYPTTTYRPVNFYLPTKSGEKISPTFNWKNSDIPLEIVSNESSNSKKRIKKVKKVLRNNPKNKNKKNRKDIDEKEVGETTTLLDVKPLIPLETIKKSSEVRKDRLSSYFEPTFPSFERQSSNNTKEMDSYENSSESFFTKELSSSKSEKDETSRLYLPHDSYLDPVRSLPKTNPTNRWRSRQAVPTSDLNLYQLNEDEIFASSKKSRGLPILNQLENRPVTPTPLRVALGPEVLHQDSSTKFQLFFLSKCNIFPIFFKAE